jgi:RNA polymerase sigma-70 factor (ECF subfamily)
LFLARLVAELMPAEPEALGLLALVLHAEARRRARRREVANTSRSAIKIRDDGTGR